MKHLPTHLSCLLSDLPPALRDSVEREFGRLLAELDRAQANAAWLHGLLRKWTRAADEWHGKVVDLRAEREVLTEDNQMLRAMLGAKEQELLVLRVITKMQLVERGHREYQRWSERSLS